MIRHDVKKRNIKISTSWFTFKRFETARRPDLRTSIMEVYRGSSSFLLALWNCYRLRKSNVCTNGRITIREIKTSAFTFAELYRPSRWTNIGCYLTKYITCCCNLKGKLLCNDSTYEWLSFFYPVAILPVLSISFVTYLIKRSLNSKDTFSFDSSIFFVNGILLLKQSNSVSRICMKNLCVKELSLPLYSTFFLLFLLEIFFHSKVNDYRIKNRRVRLQWVATMR